MISIDEGVVDAAAPNAEAIKNGRGFVLKNKFTVLNISEDETIVFGECLGSGREPYRCSSDFARPDKPFASAAAPLRAPEPSVTRRMKAALVLPGRFVFQRGIHASRHLYEPCPRRAVTRRP